MPASGEKLKTLRLCLSHLFSLQQLPELAANGVVVRTQTAQPCRRSRAPTSPLADSHECSTADWNKVGREEAIYS